MTCLFLSHSSKTFAWLDLRLVVFACVVLYLSFKSISWIHINPTVSQLSAEWIHVNPCIVDSVACFSIRQVILSLINVENDPILVISFSSMLRLVDHFIFASLTRILWVCRFFSFRFHFGFETRFCFLICVQIRLLLVFTWIFKFGEALMCAYLKLRSLVFQETLEGFFTFSFFLFYPQNELLPFLSFY